MILSEAKNAAIAVFVGHNHSKKLTQEHQIHGIACLAGARFVTRSNTAVVEEGHRANDLFDELMHF